MLFRSSWAVLGEHAECLEDVMVRRFNLAYGSRKVFEVIAPRIANHMASILGRNEAWESKEVDGLRESLWAWSMEAEASP